MTTTIDERIRRYVDKIPGAVSGARGHDATFKVACILIHGFDLTPDQAFPHLAEWNHRCDPPWSESQLRHKLKSACKAPSQNPRGYLIEGNRNAPRSTPPQQQAGPRRPDRSGFGPGTTDHLQRLYQLRRIPRFSLKFAMDRGVLVFGSWRGLDCYGVTDKSARVLEIRRLDGGLFPAVEAANLDERKSHAVRGSNKRWPVGILEAKDHPSIALVEGMPDFLEAHNVILWGALGWTLYVLALVGALLTGAYAFRLYFAVFHGEAHEAEHAVEGHGHGHGEGPLSMLVPVGVLTVLATVGGLVVIPGVWHPLTHWVEESDEALVHPSTAQDYLTSVLAVGLGLVGLWYARRAFQGDRQLVTNPSVWRVLEHKLYFDEAYDALFYRPAAAIAGTLRDRVY